MKITDRFEEMFDCKAYWDSNVNRLSLYFDREINVDKVKFEVYRKLDFLGLTRAVDSLLIVSSD